MGTAIQTYNLNSDDYQGKDACPEILNFSKPTLIQSIHESYFKAGANVVETNTFGASVNVLEEYDLQDQAYEISKRAARLASEVAKDFTSSDKPRFVAGSIGPGLKLPSLLHIEPKTIYQAYQPQIRGMMDGGADVLLIETSQDMLHAKTVLRLIYDEFRRSNTFLPLILSVTIEKSGTMLVGSDIATVIHTFSNYPLAAMGINCATGPADMANALKTLHDLSPFPTFVMPNAGMPENINGEFIYNLKPEKFAAQLLHYIEKFGTNIVGGCCGTTPEHIQALTKLSQSCHKLRDSSKLSVNPVQNVTSLYNSQLLKVEPAPLLIGERTNASGSKKFRELLLAEDFEAMGEVASSQIAEGAHILDVNLAYVGRDEKADMVRFIKMLNTLSSIPLQVDTTSPDVMEAALQHIAGKALLNSANLEDGEDKFDKIAGLAKKYSASLIMLTIDEVGMAKSVEEKLSIAERMIKRAVDVHGLKEADLLIDPLTFTLASGDEESAHLAIETLNAISLIKKKFPEVSIILGLSNISFGLKPRARHILNTMMLSEAVKAGMDAAIVHAGKLKAMNQISDEMQKLALDLIYNRQIEGEETPLMLFVKAFENLSTEKISDSIDQNDPLEIRLKRAIVNGLKKKIYPLLEEALEKYKPFEIINGFLLDGMKEVGEYFANGKMQLPFVLQSAETMKTAVIYLEQFMNKDESAAKASLLLATVKGDVHDIGKNLVEIVLSNNGFQVYNLGIKQSVENILAGVEKYKPDVIGLSGLLVKSVQIMKENLELFEEKGMDIPIILGGAALTRKYVENDLRKLYKGPLYYAADAFKGLDLMNKIHSGDMPLIVPPTSHSHTPTPTLSHTPTPTLSHTPTPKMPFTGVRKVCDVNIDDCLPFFNFNTLFKGQWRLKKTPDMSKQAYDDYLKKDGMEIFNDLLNDPEVKNKFNLKYAYTYLYCASDNENLHLYKNKSDSEPWFRWLFPRQKGGGLSIPDYFRTVKEKEKDIIALQIVTIGDKVSPYLKKLYGNNEYQKYLYINGIFAEMTEALAEYVHSQIRKELNLSIDKKKQGKRYSFGYPACPDLEQQKDMMRILDAESLGLTLSEEYQIHPEFSTSAFVLHHPEAKYFSVK